MLPYGLMIRQGTFTDVSKGIGKVTSMLLKTIAILFYDKSKRSSLMKRERVKYVKIAIRLERHARYPVACSWHGSPVPCHQLLRVLSRSSTQNQGRPLFHRSPSMEWDMLFGSLQFRPPLDDIDWHQCSGPLTVLSCYQRVVCLESPCSAN